MPSSARPDTTFVLGFAVGLGLCAAVVLGLPLLFWQDQMNLWLAYALTFLVGAVVGALFAPLVYRADARAARLTADEAALAGAEARVRETGPKAW